MTVYVVCNSKREFYRSYSARRRGGWVKDIDDAKVYTKRGPALGMVSRLRSKGFAVELVTLVAREPTRSHGDDCGCKSCVGM